MSEEIIWKKNEANNINIDILNEYVFHGNNIIFIKSPIIYKFSHACEVTKTKYNYKIANLNKSDVSEINKLIASININLKIHTTGFYISGKETKFKLKGFPDENIEFTNNQKWKIEVRIQGYKKSEAGNFSPIWNMIVAKKVV